MKDRNEVAGKMVLNIKNENELYKSYMGYLESGGIFIPTKKEYHLGQKVRFFIRLKNEEELHPVRGKIVWVTPVGSGGRTPGVGVQFDENDEDSRATRLKIEETLTVKLGSSDVTYTM